MGFPSGLVVKNLPSNARRLRDEGSIPEEKNGNPFWYSCHGQKSLKAIVHKVTKSPIRLRN